MTEYPGEGCCGNGSEDGGRKSSGDGPVSWLLAGSWAYREAGLWNLL